MKIKKELLQAFLDKYAITAALLAREMGVAVAEVEKLLCGTAVCEETARRFIYYFGADEEFVVKRYDKLRHLHIHDAEGDKCHLPLDEGKTDWRKYLAMAGYRGCRAVIETKTVAGLEASVYVLRKENFIK